MLEQAATNPETVTFSSPLDSLVEAPDPCTEEFLIGVDFLSPVSILEAGTILKLTYSHSKLAS